MKSTDIIKASANSLNIYSFTAEALERMIEAVKAEQPCQTCEALARTVMLDQTSHDTSPPASKPWVHATTWRGLTDVNEMVEAELTHYWNGEYADTTGARDQLTDFARAIEAKLKDKNGF